MERYWLYDHLEDEGFEVKLSHPLKTKAIAYAKVKPDIVIMDEVLPSGDGMEACYQLHGTFGILVILLGEDFSDEVWGRVMEAGADLYLLKPVRYRELVARVKAIFRRYKARGNT